jgi:hypothetical protein
MRQVAAASGSQRPSSRIAWVTLPIVEPKGISLRRWY